MCPDHYQWATQLFLCSQILLYILLPKLTDGNLWEPSRWRDDRSNNKKLFQKQQENHRSAGKHFSVLTIVQQPSIACYYRLILLLLIDGKQCDSCYFIYGGTAALVKDPAICWSLSDPPYLWEVVQTLSLISYTIKTDKMIKKCGISLQSRAGGEGRSPRLSTLPAISWDARKVDSASQKFQNKAIYQYRAGRWKKQRVHVTLVPN